MKEEKLYKDLAKYYDLVYSDKDYEEEVREIKDIISEWKESNGNKLLDAACGSGRHLKYLSNDFACTGLDLNEKILEIAEERLGDVKLIQADMTDFSLEEKFDVITCLFSSIGYVKTYKKLRKTVENFVDHLKEGGVVIIEPWLTKDLYNEGSVHMKTFDGEGTKVARVSYSGREGDLSKVEMHYLVGEEGAGIKHFKEIHKLGLFEREEILGIMEDFGLKSKRKEKEGSDRGFYIGVKE